LSYFTLSQTTGGQKFAVGIDTSAPAGSTITFTYYVDTYTTISQVGITLLIYRTSSYPSSYVLYPTNSASYTSNLNTAASGTSGGYQNGFEDKCIVGHTQLSFLPTFTLAFSISNLPSASYATTYSSSDPTLNVNLFCLIMNFDCSTIDVNCLGCTSYTVCSQCQTSYFPYVYTNLSSRCQLCSSAIAGCNVCTSATACTTCITPTYLMDAGLNTCAPCNKYMANCLNCTSTTACTGCVTYYGLSSGACKLCSSMVAGCQVCTDALHCTKCLNGYYLDGSGVCQLCSAAIDNCAICDNSTYCDLCNSDSYLGANNTICICNPGLYSVSGLCSVAGCTSAYRFGTATVCLACNTSANFYLSSSTCNCMIGYSLNVASCSVICGDSRVIN